MDIVSVSAQDAAKALRRDLKAAFGKYYPTTTFSVTTKQEMGYAYIYVRWTGAPLFREVNKVAQNFRGYDEGDRTRPIINEEGGKRWQYRVSGVICQRQDRNANLD